MIRGNKRGPAPNLWKDSKIREHYDTIDTEFEQPRQNNTIKMML